MKRLGHYLFCGPLADLKAVYLGFAQEPRLVPRALLVVCLPLVLSPSAPAADSEAAADSAIVTFVQPPEGARVLTISLSAVESPGRSTGYLMQRSPEPALEAPSLPAAIRDAYAGKTFFSFDIARLPDGTRYFAVLSEDKSVKFLNRNESAFWFARVYRVALGPDAQPEVLREGFQSSGNDVTVPVELELPGLGATRKKKVKTEIGYNLSGMNEGKPLVYTGRSSALQVSGSQVVREGKLTMNVSVPEELQVTSETQLTLRFEPVTPGLPERTASGKVGDYLTIGSARFVVTAMARDFSQASVAVVAGSLEETLKQQLQLGAQMPAFAQVELVTRKTITREEVLSKARGGAPVLFVFGDLPIPRSPYGPSYPGGTGMTGSLPIPPAEVADQLSLEMDPKPLVVFVTRQIGIEFLYSDLRNKTPDYFILTDYADPLRTQFRVIGPGRLLSATLRDVTRTVAPATVQSSGTHAFYRCVRRARKGGLRESRGCERLSRVARRGPRGVQKDALTRGATRGIRCRRTCVFIG